MKSASPSNGGQHGTGALGGASPSTATSRTPTHHSRQDKQSATGKAAGASSAALAATSPATDASPATATRSTTRNGGAVGTPSKLNNGHGPADPSDDLLGLTSTRRPSLLLPGLRSSPKPPGGGGNATLHPELRFNDEDLSVDNMDDMNLLELELEGWDDYGTGVANMENRDADDAPADDIAGKIADHGPSIVLNPPHKQRSPSKEKPVGVASVANDVAVSTTSRKLAEDEETAKIDQQEVKADEDDIDAQTRESSNASQTPRTGNAESLTTSLSTTANIKTPTSNKPSQASLSTAASSRPSRHQPTAPTPSPQTAGTPRIRRVSVKGREAKPEELEALLEEPVLTRSRKQLTEVIELPAATRRRRKRLANGGTPGGPEETVSGSTSPTTRLPEADVSKVLRDTTAVLEKDDGEGGSPSKRLRKLQSADMDPMDLDGGAATSSTAPARPSVTVTPVKQTSSDLRGVNANAKKTPTAANTTVPASRSHLFESGDTPLTSMGSDSPLTASTVSPDQKDKGIMDEDTNDVPDHFAKSSFTESAELPGDAGSIMDSVDREATPAESIAASESRSVTVSATSAAKNLTQRAGAGLSASAATLAKNLTKPLTRSALLKDASLAATVAASSPSVSTTSTLTRRRAQGQRKDKAELGLAAAMAKSAHHRPYNPAKMAAAIPALRVASPSLFRDSPEIKNMVKSDVITPVDLAGLDRTRVVPLPPILEHHLRNQPAAAPLTDMEVDVGSAETTAPKTFPSTLPPGPSSLAHAPAPPRHLPLLFRIPSPLFASVFGPTVTNLPATEHTIGPLPDAVVESALHDQPAASTWLPAELEAFDRGLEACGRNFTLLSRDFVPSRSTQECIHMYYRRKHALRFTRVKQYKKQVQRDEEEYVRYVNGIAKFIASEARRLKQERGKGGFLAAAAAAAGGSPMMAAGVLGGEKSQVFGGGIFSNGPTSAAGRRYLRGIAAAGTAKSGAAPGVGAGLLGTKISNPDGPSFAAMKPAPRAPRTASVPRPTPASVTSTALRHASPALAPARLAETRPGESAAAEDTAVDPDVAADLFVAKMERYRRIAARTTVVPEPLLSTFGKEIVPPPEPILPFRALRNRARAAAEEAR
ncbi:hypothetical protein HDU96_005530 [Phlyctochytrium bullatum]|nr:hypothetical protein HDU96_005530 [Phlyctochytrium bullatum]